MKNKKIIFWLMMAWLLVLCGCSTQQQKCTVKVEVYDDRAVYMAVPSVSKTNFLYWSKFQADTDTFGMTTKVYNAEGQPDAEAIQAFTEGILEAVAQAFSMAK